MSTTGLLTWQSSGRDRGRLCGGLDPSAVRPEGDAVHDAVPARRCYPMASRGSRRPRPANDLDDGPSWASVVAGGLRRSGRPGEAR